MVDIDFSLKAMRSTSYIAALEEGINNRGYIVGELNPGGYRHPEPLRFPFREDTEPLPVNTPIEVVLLGTGAFEGKKDDEGDISNVLSRVMGVHTLFGVRVPEDSEYFNFYKQTVFVTGIVYHVGTDSYQQMSASIKEIRKAHELLYSNTKDTRSIPEGLAEDDFGAILFHRARQLGDITNAYIAPRNIRELHL